MIQASDSKLLKQSIRSMINSRFLNLEMFQFRIKIKEIIWIVGDGGRCSIVP
ncbi:hypothetical protein IQ270_06510 [Microcoleus sp. LEGE 07076]|uniref:hypothetical protein n=1 Tax=Microcoleus sp. LEGE 07076 TaxID=915322 RepID=UPI0018800B92|nr:hypothetical protein [Microcoleus sp. LEGE 07076]MBE9184380.1 hypothetical protein [Microcoleus sp. LEGE 07076]